MKKNAIYALMSAIALSGAIGFSSCSSTEDDVANVNPGYDPATGDVPVHFVFNVSTSNTPSTRMTSEATQATSSDPFRGIDHAMILSTHQENDGKHISTAVEMNKIYDLSRILAANTISSSESRRVLEMAFPLNTNTLMVYGKAIEGSANATQTAAGLTSYDVYGHLKTDGGYKVVENLSQVSFETARRLTTAQVANYRKVQELLAGMLTCIMYTNMKGGNHVAINGSLSPEQNVPTYVFDVATTDYNEFTWGDYANAEGISPSIPTKEDGTPAPLTPLELKLAQAYTAMTTINKDGGELRNGSGEALEMMIQDLWTIVNEVRCATPTSKAETIAKYLAARIDTHIRNYMRATVPTTGAAVTGVDFLDTQDVITAFAGDDAWPANAGSKPTGFDNIKTVPLDNFPHNYNLPEGATHLQFAKVSDTYTDKVFSYVWTYNTSGMVGVTPESFTVESYYFPPELLYFGNSAIRVSDEEHTVDQYPQGVTAWDNDGSWNTNWTKNGHVLSSTRSVAMINDINYGTALLKTQVGYQSTTLKDNNSGIHTGEQDNTITAGANSFQLVGLLIGGQPKKVGWNFLPAEATEYGYVYDCHIPSTTIPIEGVSSANYTLVFDNYSATGAALETPAQDVVNIALEIRNNSGKDFYGLNGLIRDGGVFYLIAQLDPAGKSIAAWPEHHALPPYNENGTTKQTPRVFIQDHMTSVTFRLGQNALKSAYLTVPDLRSSSLTLGLSVDISWSTGIDFGDVIIGGE